MSTTESDSSQNTVDSHKTAVREYLRIHGEISKPTHLTGSGTRAHATA